MIPPLQADLPLLAEYLTATLLYRWPPRAEWLFLLLATVLMIVALLMHAHLKLRRKNHQLMTTLSKAPDPGAEKTLSGPVSPDIHEQLHTRIAALRWQLETLGISTRSTPDKKLWQQSLRLLDDIDTDVRLISHSYIPAELEAGGLVPALRRLINQLNRGKGPEFHLVSETNGKRPALQVEYQLYNTALMLVNQILKRARATQVWISVTQTTRLLTLTISDNDTGIAEGALAENPDIKQIKNRTESAGGYLKIESNHLHGTKMAVGMNPGTGP